MKFGSEDLVLETGRLAKQADGAVMVSYGGTVVLVSAMISNQPKAGVDFLPLTVEYQEKTYAAGKIPGGFFKREGRPTEKAILTSRLIDRPIRPQFPKGFTNEVQVIALTLSHDGAHDPDVLGILGASAALGLAGAPIRRVGACRVGRVDGQFVLNPTYEQIEKGDLDLVVVCGKDGIVMVEAGAKEIPEDALVDALKFGMEEGMKTIRLQEELIGSHARKREFPVREPAAELVEKIRRLAEPKIAELLRARSQKEGGDGEEKTFVADLLAQVQNVEGTVTEAEVEEVIGAIEKKLVRKAILEKGERMDGRDRSTVRQITCDVGVLPRTHGSGLFQRGQTQGLVTTTLGTGDDEQMIDALQGKWYKSFMLHYNFPPFSVGEIRPVRGTGRREIGHGALAERAIQAVIPDKEKFPYTLRVVSEILESNGSSSMATVCGATLSLMDAGVPLKSPVSGIAMGLVKEGEKYVILTDIIGLEDHFGDMDFKVAGTAKGITALQLDLKLTGVSVKLLEEALEQARPARTLILEKMQETIPSPRAELSPYAPRITLLKINPEKIGELIGPGGKMIRKITGETGVSIDVEDDGTVKVASTDAEASRKAIAMIEGITKEAEIGRVYQGVVRRIMNFGAFFEIAPGKEGLCHVSELSDQFVPKVEDIVKVGDTLPVKVVEIDMQGRINLSHRQALLPPGTPPVPPARRPGGGDRERGGRGGDRGGRPFGGGDRGGGEFRRGPGGDRGGPGSDRGRGPGGDRGGHRGPGREAQPHPHSSHSGPAAAPERTWEERTPE
ncbi:MAG: polyribonucleotide nucleotidyltransferase [Candidatus Omnitrophica bacterium]|nr:polyribonucleotide nucleotidyltransferase [Candidatus Omnitrophota bacterium]